MGELPPTSPSMVPIQWFVNVVPAEPEALVAIEARHPSRVFVGFLNPRDAHALGMLIREKAAAATRTLHLPTNGEAGQ